MLLVKDDGGRAFYRLRAGRLDLNAEVLGAEHRDIDPEVFKDRLVPVPAVGKVERWSAAGKPRQPTANQAALHPCSECNQLFQHFVAAPKAVAIVVGAA